MPDVPVTYRYVQDQAVQHPACSEPCTVVEQRTTLRPALGVLVEYLLRLPTGTTFWARERDIQEMDSHVSA
jgi:hypothetical protein